MDLLRSFFDDDGRLCRVRAGTERRWPLRDAVGLALLYAYVREQRDAVDFLLEKDGNWDMIGVNNGAALHRAAFAGDLDMVRRLVERGADTATETTRSTRRRSHGPTTTTRLRSCSGCGRIAPSTCTMPPRSIFTSTSTARLKEDPASVNMRIDHWDIPQATALHWAASMGHAGAAALLLDHGADVNIVAGNGMTPLDVADANGSSVVVGAA